MPDQIFEHPRLVAIYDFFDGDRKDLDHYVALAKELKAKSVLDLVCETGCFASRLSEEKFASSQKDHLRQKNLQAIGRLV